MAGIHKGQPKVQDSTFNVVYHWQASCLTSDHNSGGALLYTEDIF